MKAYCYITTKPCFELSVLFNSWWNTSHLARADARLFCALGKARYSHPQIPNFDLKGEKMKRWKAQNLKQLNVFFSSRQLSALRLTVAPALLLVGLSWGRKTKPLIFHLSKTCWVRGRTWETPIFKDRTLMSLTQYLNNLWSRDLAWAAWSRPCVPLWISPKRVGYLSDQYHILEKNAKEM